MWPVKLVEEFPNKHMTEGEIKKYEQAVEQLKDNYALRRAVRNVIGEAKARLGLEGEEDEEDDEDGDDDQ